MGDLIVRPSYVFGPTEILTSEKLNLMGTPVVELALSDPVNDQNFFRNGNFYSSFWTTPAGVTCPVNVWTTNASYWLCRPQGNSLPFVRTASVPDLYSLYSAAIIGNTGVTSMEFGQQINGDLAATMRRNVTFSGYLYNNTALVVSPVLNFYTANAFNNFATITLQKTVNLQSMPTTAWTYVTATVDLTAVANVANGLLIAVQTTGVLTVNTKSIYFSRLKVQIGEVATEFVDDTSLFVQAPSVDSTMLQDGCIARPTLFGPKVIPSTAYIDKSVITTAINDAAVTSVKLAAGASVANIGYTPVNKAGDSMTAAAQLQFTRDNVVGASAAGTGAVALNSTTTNASNAGYFPAISFNRPSAYARAIGLGVTGRFITVDHVNNQGYLLDSYFKVATADIQDGAVTIAKLAQEVINMIIPPGIMAFFSGPTPPAGWYIADGSAVSRTVNAALFAAIGTYWGAGDNVSTFNLPDLRGRVPLGYGSAPGITGHTFGSRGGEEAHVMTVAEMPSHTHAMNHAHSYVTVNSGSGIASGSGWAVVNATTGDVSNGMGAAGSSNGFNILQPYAVGVWIVKA